MVQMDNSLIDYQGRGLTYPQPGELSVHQLPSPADTMNALPSYDAYANQNIMLSGANYPLFNDNHHDGSAQWNASMGGGNAYSSMDDGSAPAPMTCSPGSGQIIIPELGDENQMERNTMVRFHNSPGALTTFDPSVVNMRHPSTPASASDHGASEEIESMDPQTPRRLTRSRSHLRRQSGSDPYPTPSTGGSSESPPRTPPWPATTAPMVLPSPTPWLLSKPKPLHRTQNPYRANRVYRSTPLELQWKFSKPVGCPWVYHLTVQ
ncbi:hypothetical protein RHS01_00651 [Rhizoctonia solani]|uniref:Uncharacterized protein n=1 Tax=Rhizoctonia solani TaxID=456999 RepID=A0A8H7M9L4_9AGAM|nr:hypothetical protein RHS01_00651 [Rhizoctonia solani]